MFFNTSKNRYDTLKSKLTVYVTGESKKNEAIESNDAGAFYDKIASADNDIHVRQDNGWMKTALSLFTIVILGASVYFVFKKQAA